MNRDKRAKLVFITYAERNRKICYKSKSWNPTGLAGKAIEMAGVTNSLLVEVIGEDIFM